MSAPNVPGSIDILGKAKAEIDALLAKLIAISPDALKGDEAAIQAALDAALSGIDVSGVSDSLAQALAVVKDFGGIVGPGVTTSLVP